MPVFLHCFFIDSTAIIFLKIKKSVSIINTFFSVDYSNSEHARHKAFPCLRWSYGWDFTVKPYRVIYFGRTQLPWCCASSIVCAGVSWLYEEFTVSFKSHSSTQENQIIQARNGLWKDSNYFFSKHFLGKKIRKVRSLPSSTVFWPKTAEIWPRGIITLCSMSVPSPGTMPHQSDSCPQCCRQSWVLCAEEEISRLRDSLFSIAPTAGVYRGFRGC